MLENVRYAPVIFQEYILAVLDVRVTVVGDDVFESKIATSGGTDHYDYRAELDTARIVAHHLPDDVQNMCRQLLRRLGLVYGAIDLRLTPEGAYVFLEISPSREWLFMEERTGQRITQSFCNFLVAHDG